MYLNLKWLCLSREAWINVPFSPCAVNGRRTLQTCMARAGLGWARFSQPRVLCCPSQQRAAPWQLWGMLCSQQNPSRGGSSSHRDWWGAGKGCPERLWCPIPGDAQGQIGWGPAQSELVGGSPAHGRVWGWVGFEGPFTPNHSVILCLRPKSNKFV